MRYLIGLLLSLSVTAQAAEFVPHLSTGVVFAYGLNVDGSSSPISGGLQAGMNIFHININNIDTDVSYNGAIFGDFSANTDLALSPLGFCALTNFCVFLTLPIKTPDGFGLFTKPFRWDWGKVGFRLTLNWDVLGHGGVAAAKHPALLQN